MPINIVEVRLSGIFDDYLSSVNGAFIRIRVQSQIDAANLKGKMEPRQQLLGWDEG